MPCLLVWLLVTVPPDGLPPAEPLFSPGPEIPDDPVGSGDPSEPEGPPELSPPVELPDPEDPPPPAVGLAGEDGLGSAGVFEGFTGVGEGRIPGAGLTVVVPGPTERVGWTVTVSKGGGLAGGVVGGVWGLDEYQVNVSEGPLVVVTGCVRVAPPVVVAVCVA